MSELGPMDLVPDERVSLSREFDPATGILSFYGYGVFEGVFETKPTFEQMYQSFEDQLAGHVPKRWSKEESRDHFEDTPLSKTCFQPRFRTDDGDIVWGIQCKWRRESEFKEMLSDIGHRIMLIPVKVTPLDIEIIEQLR